MEPILKWAGGKRLLLPKLLEVIDFETLKNNGGTFFEPFIGGGALCFGTEYQRSVINDLNEEIINVYRVIKKSPHKLIDQLTKYKYEFEKDKSFYYFIRSWDRDAVYYSNLTNIQRAARTIFLNKTCYNGLYRTNLKGQFNVPIGRNKSFNIINRERIMSLHKYLLSSDVQILNGDFSKAVVDAKPGDVIYFDPPYDYEPSGFTAYNASGFGKDSTARLKRLCDELVKKGCLVYVSNNDTKFVNELFSEKYYKIYHIYAHRFINRNANNRTLAKEVIICGKK